MNRFQTYSILNVTAFGLVLPLSLPIDIDIYSCYTILIIFCRVKEQICTDELLNKTKKKKISDVGLPELSYENANQIPKITPEELKYITYELERKSNADALCVQQGIKNITNEQLKSSTYLLNINRDRRRKSKSNAERELQKERKVQRK